MRIRQQDSGSWADNVIITLSKQKSDIQKYTRKLFVSKQNKKSCEH
jgi:hypothetical protein